MSVQARHSRGRYATTLGPCRNTSSAAAAMLREATDRNLKGAQEDLAENAAQYIESQPGPVAGGGRSPIGTACRRTPAAEGVFAPQLPADPSQTRARGSEVRRGKVWSYQVRPCRSGWGFRGSSSGWGSEKGRTSEPVTSSEAAAMPSPVWTGRPLDWPGSFAAENHDFLVRDVSFAMDRRPLGFCDQLLAAMAGVQSDRRDRAFCRQTLRTAGAVGGGVSSRTGPVH